MWATEINSSFYKPHRRSTYERWAASTPTGFRFSVKLPKEISHARKLIGAEALLDAFVAQVTGLESKLGVVLVQLPPSLPFSERVASEFIAMLRERLEPDVRIALEPRHPSWFVEEGATCLAEHHVARVSADPILAPGGGDPSGWTGFVYRRLHGSPRVYHSAYDEHTLTALAGAVARDVEAGRPTWLFFDNTASGAALGDAMRLRSLLSAMQTHGSQFGYAGRES